MRACFLQSNVCGLGFGQAWIINPRHDPADNQSAPGIENAAHPVSEISQACLSGLSWEGRADQSPNKPVDL
jgi:hypothetical protein